MPHAHSDSHPIGALNATACAALAVCGAEVALPADASKVTIEWKRRQDADAMSNLRTVESYKAEYRRRYARYLSAGELSPAADSWRAP